MRILHCLRAPVGGLFRHVLDLAGEQARRGHDVGILADRNAEDRLTEEKFAAIAPLLTLGILRTPMSRQPGLGDLKAYRAVLAHAQGLNLDVLHGHGAKGGAYARLVRRALRARTQTVKAYYTPHGGSLHYRPGTPQARLFLAAERLLERHCDSIIFESAYASRAYAERIHTPDVPTRIIPNGLQPDDFAPVEHGPDAADFLFIGELRDVKGVHHLLEALADARLRDASAVIVGSGPEAGALQALATSSGVANRVRFAGALPAREAFALGRIMVVPSLAESFPYVVLEAAAAGLPLISTSVGGIPEIVAGTMTDLIEPGSTKALAEAMVRTLTNRPSAEVRARELKDNVARKFTVARMTDDVLSAYAFTLP